MTEHAAILKAQEINDSERDDLLPHEAALTRAVYKAGWHRTNSYVAAQMFWGDIPKMYRSHLIAADEHHRKVLDAALAAYHAALEDA